MHVMPGSLFRRVAGVRAADLQNKYQKNAREIVIVFIMGFSFRSALVKSEAWYARFGIHFCQVGR